MIILKKQVKQLCLIAVFGRMFRVPKDERENMRYFLSFDYVCGYKELRRKYKITEKTFIDILLDMVAYDYTQPSETVLQALYDTLELLEQSYEYFTVPAFAEIVTKIKEEQILPALTKKIAQRTTKIFFDDDADAWITEKHLNERLGNIPDNVRRYAKTEEKDYVKYYKISEVAKCLAYEKKADALLTKLYTYRVKL